MRPAVRRPLVSLALAGAGVLLAAPSAGAHANLAGSDPASGAVLEAVPTEVTLSFTEPPELKLSTVEVLDATGRSVGVGEAEALPGDAKVLRLGMEPSLGDGSYTVSWRVVSKVDGHATAGAVTFGVGQDLDPGAVGSVTVQEGPPLSGLEVAGRLGLLAGLAAGFGGALVALVSFRGDRRGLAAYVAVAAALALLGLAGLTAAQRAAAGAGLGDLLGSAVGTGLVRRAVAVGVLLVAGVVAWTARGRVRAGALGLAAAAALAGMLAEAAAGHAAGANRFPAGNVVAQWVHFGAVGLWLGGLGALLLGVRGAPDEEKARGVRRYSAMAGIALFVVIGTGTVRAINEVGSWGDLVRTGYGRVVLAKIAIVAILAALGAVNRYRNVPRAPSRLTGLRAVSRVEVGVAIVALVATALLTALSPPSQSVAQEPAAPAARPIVVEGTDFAGGVEVRLQVAPGVPGPNRFEAVVRDADTGAPVDAQRVALRFAFAGDAALGESTLELSRTGPGRYAGRGTNLALEGAWDLILLVQETADAREVPLAIRTACTAQVLSSAEGQPTIYTSSLPDDASVQGYVDPGRSGVNEVHFTFFTAEGTELAVTADPEILATGPEGQTPPLDVRRFSEGHFIANGELEGGRWRFDVGGAGGLTGCFEEMIEG